METETFLLMFIQMTILVSDTAVGTFLFMVSSLCVSRVSYILSHYHLPEKEMFQAMMWLWMVAQRASWTLGVVWFVGLLSRYFFAVSICFNGLHLSCWWEHICHSTLCRSCMWRSIDNLQKLDPTLWHTSSQLKLGSSAMPLFAETNYWSIKRSLKTFFA